MNVQEIKDLIASLRQANPSLVDIQSVCDKLQSFVDETEKTVDLACKVDGLTTQIKTLQTFCRDLNGRMGNVEGVLSTQKDQLFLTDQEYRGLLKQIQTVLVGLEDYLRRHT